MKKFRILLVDVETGHDLYDRFEVYAESFFDVVIRLVNLGINFRLIEDITRYALPGNFNPSEWSAVPVNAIRKS